LSQAALLEGGQDEAGDDFRSHDQLYGNSTFSGIHIARQIALGVWFPGDRRIQDN
jgi:hypothetical protein